MISPEKGGVEEHACSRSIAQIAFCQGNFKAPHRLKLKFRQLPPIPFPLQVIWQGIDVRLPESHSLTRRLPFSIDRQHRFMGTLTNPATGPDMSSLADDAGVDLDFTGVFKLSDLKVEPPAAPPVPKKVPDDILIGAQELSKGNCFINMTRRRAARAINVTKITVLIVEDDRTTQYLLHMLLSRAGFVTRRAGSAAEFIAAMQKAPLPDLIILDIELKENISGFKILAKIRSHPKISKLPVIILSGRTDPGDLMQGVTLGADAYLSKPTKAKSLMDAVHAVLGG